MAYVDIEPIKAGTHLRNLVEYIRDMDKTDYRRLTDSYKCNFITAEIDFEMVRDLEVIKKGNNIAWHLTQSFSPEDNVTPEQALEIGKELMRRMYPEYQYLIATHIDKEHIHNHILINSVNFVDYHKLHSNKWTLQKLRNISNDICRENGLSVIPPDSKIHKRRLKENIDKAIEVSADYDDFIACMQEMGYSIKFGERLKFKDEQMQQYISSTSISQSYSEDLIKYRLENKGKDVVVDQKRTIYDDKIVARSKKKKLKLDIDKAIKQASTYQEFIQIMKKSGYEVKQGKHLTFKLITGDAEQDKKARGRRSEQLGLHYQEEVIKYRINHKEEYKAMADNKVLKMIDLNNERIKGNATLKSWAKCENSNIANATEMWVRRNLLDDWLSKNGFSRDTFNDGRVSLLYAVFLDYYDRYTDAKNSFEDTLRSMEQVLNAIRVTVNAIEQYWILKPAVEGYKNADVSKMESEEYEAYQSIMGKWYKYGDIVKKGKDKFGTLSIRELKQKYIEILEQKEEFQERLARFQLAGEELDTIKYNFELPCGHLGEITNRDKAEAAINNYKHSEEIRKQEEAEKQFKQVEKEQRKEERKKSVRKFFGLG